MKKIIITIITVVLTASCIDHNDLVLKYGELYTADIEAAEALYHRVDSLIDCNYGREEKLSFKEENERRIENIKELETRFDYAQFRFNYFTTKGLKRLVDVSLEDWNQYIYVGKYHTYRITRKPSKKGIDFIDTRDIID